MMDSKKRMELIERYKEDADSLSKAELREMCDMYHDLAMSTSKAQVDITEILLNYVTGPAVEALEKVNSGTPLEELIDRLAAVANASADFSENLLKIINKSLERTAKISGVSEADMVLAAKKQIFSSNIDLSYFSPFQVIDGGQEDN